MSRLATPFAQRLTTIAKAAVCCFSTTWFRCLLLVAAGTLAHSPALQGERIWDDLYLSHDNPFIKSPLLILETFRHYLFLDSLSAHYRPVQNISFMVDYFFWNNNEFGFHLTNVLLHIGSGVLLYFLLRELLISLRARSASLAARQRFVSRGHWFHHAAFILAFLWTLHPVHSAAIDYISGRADSLAFLFATGAWLLFFRARRTIRPAVRRSLYCCAGSGALLALLSREIAIVWIALFLAHTLFVERNASRRLRLGALICSLAIVAVYAGLRQLPSQRLTVISQEGWRAPVRAVLMMRALGDYTRLMLFPTNLHMERTVFDPANYRSNSDWRRSISTEYLSILGFALLSGLILGCIKKSRGQPVRIFGAAWFLAAYLPISNIVLLNATVAEHWLYLPAVGFLIFAYGCVLELPEKYWSTAVTVALVAAGGLATRTYVRSTDWVKAETFYRRTLAAGGTSARTGLNLGQIYANRGDYAEGEKIFRKVLEIAPGYPTAQNNLAAVLTHEGKSKEAEELFATVEKESEKTRLEYPRTWIGALNLARARYNARDYHSSISILDKARHDYSDVWDIISFESEVLRKTKGPEAALKLVENFAHENWWHQAAALALGRLYAQKNDVSQAETALFHASRLDVHDTEALRLIVQIRMRQNRFADAVQTQRRAIARQPDEPRQYILLSDILFKMGRTVEAQTAMAKSQSLVALAQSQAAVN